MSIGSNIKYWRELRNLKQSELAEKLGVSDKTISSWEINRTEPKMGMIERISKELQCKKTDIIGTSDSDTLRINDKEYSLLEDYRNLSPGLKKRLEAYVKALSNMHSLEEPVLNAANKRMDIDFTEDTDTSDDDIMDDPNF